MGRLSRTMAIGVIVVAVGVGAFFAGRESAPTTTAPTPTTTSTTPSTTTTSSSTTTTTTPASAICQVSQLHIGPSGAGAAAGTNERTFSLTNTSTRTCTLDGYPGMLLLGTGNATEPTDVVRGGALSFEDIGPSSVRLGPGATAYFNVGYSDVTPPCSTATAVEVTPPTDTAHAVVPVSPSIMACNNGTLDVSAVFGPTDAAATQTTAPS